MPKTVSSALRDHLDAEATQLAAIWRITRKDRDAHRRHILCLSSGTTPNLRHQASRGGTVTITSSVAIVNDSPWSTIVGTWRPGRLKLYVDGWSRASSTAAATNTRPLFGIYRWGFSTSQDFNGDIALIACFASSWTPAMVRRWHADPFGSCAHERGACPHVQCAPVHAALDRHRRGNLPDGVVSNGL